MAQKSNRGFSSVLLIVLIGLAVLSFGIYRSVSSGSGAYPAGDSLYEASKGTVTDLGNGQKRYVSAEYNFSVDFPSTLSAGVQVSKIVKGRTEVPGFTEVNPINKGKSLSENGNPLHISISDETGAPAGMVSDIRASTFKGAEATTSVSSTSAFPGMEIIEAKLWPMNSSYFLSLWFLVKPQDVAQYKSLLAQIMTTVQFTGR